MKYCIIGDSHCVRLMGPNIITNWIEHLNVWNAMEPTKPYFELIKKAIIEKKADYFFLLMGEIDCRFFIYNVSKEKNIPIEDIITNTIERYENLILWLMQQKKIGVISAPPTGRSDQNSLVRGEKVIANFFPDMATRANIVKIYNFKLKDLCEKHNIPFVDIYSCLDDGTGVIKKELLIGDNLHYKDTAVPIETLINDVLKKHDMFTVFL